MGRIRKHGNSAQVSCSEYESGFGPKNPDPYSGSGWNGLTPSWCRGCEAPHHLQIGHEDQSKHTTPSGHNHIGQVNRYFRSGGWCWRVCGVSRQLTPFSPPSCPWKNRRNRFSISEPDTGSYVGEVALLRPGDTERAFDDTSIKCGRLFLPPRAVQPGKPRPTAGQSLHVSQSTTGALAPTADRDRGVIPTDTQQTTAA